MDTGLQPVQIFDLATQQARWLSARQALIAGNVANTNTAGYRPMDVESFDKVLAKSGTTMSTTNGRHLGGGGFGADLGGGVAESSVPVTVAGNSVTLEEELMKAGEVRRGLELNTAIVKAFHRMILMTVRS
jgi:flagellar basal-body rod protein FlgB